MAEFIRKLASVMRVDEVIEIANADALELVRLDGWKAVVKKGEFKQGELVVYIETDSLLPEKPEFEFMSKRKYRVKQIRLRGQLSDGLVFKFSDLASFTFKSKDMVGGADLTELLEIKHYQKEAEKRVEKSYTPRQKGTKAKAYAIAIKFIERLIGPINALGPWPRMFPRTDEPQIRHVFNVIKNNYVGLTCVAHEKMHGKSLTAYYHEGDMGVCSRNYELLSESTRKTTAFKKRVANALASWLGIKVVSQDQEDYWVYAKAGLLDKLKYYCESTGENLAIQLELCGPRINGNMYGFTELRGFLFNVWDITNRRYWSHTRVEEFCSQTGIERVPQVCVYPLHDDLDKYVADSSGKSLRADSIREGLVIRPYHDEVQCPSIGRLSFKVVSPEYKAKEDKLLGLE